MFTRWLTFIAFLAGSVDPESAAAGRGPLTVTPTCRVKGHPEVELTLNCGDGKNAGVVQYWHTPFGHLQIPGFHRKQDPVFVHHDGSLVVPNVSTLHSGMYYCLLQHTEGTTLWPYELHVGHDNQKNQEGSKYKQCDAFRFRRDVGPDEERHADVSDGQFAGAVAASVLLTFVVGFSAGALTRTHVLRCLEAVTTQFQSLRQHRRPTVMPKHGSEVTMTTLPPMYDNQASEMEQVQDEDDDCENCATMETTILSTSTSPPVKPQRSFRKKQEGAQETTAYLEGCDYMKEEKEEKNKGCDGGAEEEKEFSGFYLLGEDEGSQTETDEDKCSGDEEEKNREKEKEWRQREEVEENRSKEDGEKLRGCEEEEKEKDEKREEAVVGEKMREEDGETDISSEDEETNRDKKENTMKNVSLEGGGGKTLPSTGRRSRVIRLYQYDENGQRYGHLPNPAPDEPSPAPRLKQRSLSLTRLNAIMATASGGPFNTRETGEEERPHFHMEI